LRELLLGTALMAVMTVAGCAVNDPILTGLEGSEPERVAFGKPPAVQQQYLQKMQQCWLKKPGSPFAGASIDATPPASATATPPAAAGAGSVAPLQQITLRGSKPGEVLTVEFHAFNNNNTLITTRNHGFPPSVTAALEQDIETWTFVRSGCDAPAATVISAAPKNGAAPQATAVGGKAAPAPHAQPAHSG
jgi:hypothetical protein